MFAQLLLVVYIQIVFVTKMTSLSPVTEAKIFLSSFQPPTYETSPFKDLTQQQLVELTKDRTFLFFLINEENGSAMLAPAPHNALDNTFFKNLTIESEAKQLESFNPFSIPLQEKQYIIIIRDVGMTIGALNLLTSSDTYALKLRVLVALQALDKFQSYNTSLSSDTKWLVQSWLSSIAFTNDLFWKDMRDKFPELFSIRRFRLEIHGVSEAEAKLTKTQPIDIKENDDYKRLLEQDRKYADSADEKFASMKPEDYYEQMTREELMFIATWLKNLKEYSLLIELWCVLATSFQFYHFALDPEFQRMCDGVDELSVMGQFIRPLMYLMYKEESNIRERATPNMRHVTDLGQLSWQFCPEYYFHNIASMILPGNNVRFMAYSHMPHTSPLRDNTNTIMLVKPEEYKARLNSLSYNIFQDLKIPDIYVTGGLSSACLIRTYREFQNFCALVDDLGYTKNRNWQGYIKDGKLIKNKASMHGHFWPNESYTPAVRDIFLGLLGLNSTSSHQEIQVLEREAFLQTVQRHYQDADLDVAIFAKDRDEFQAKLLAFQGHIQVKLSDEKSTFQHLKADKYRMTLPNGRALEVFYMSTFVETKAGEVPKTNSVLSMIFNFHVPAVRHYYDPNSGAIKLLPSCLWAGWTGLCLDIKYFASARDPREIILKYILRGYIFALNEYERQSFHEYINSPEGKLLMVGDKRRNQSFNPVFNDLVEELRKFTLRKRSIYPKYMNNRLWSLKLNKSGFKMKVLPWEYPRNLFHTKSQLDKSEGPEYELETRVGSWKIKYELVPREGVRPTLARIPTYSTPGISVSGEHKIVAPPFPLPSGAPAASTLSLPLSIAPAVAAAASQPTAQPTYLGPTGQPLIQAIPLTALNPVASFGAPITLASMPKPFVLPTSGS